MIIIITMVFMYKKSCKSNIHKTLHPLFLNKISYIDFIKTTSDRNPILYFELRQLYAHKRRVTENDYNTILAKYR
jgi:hypothetical protein